MQRVLIRLGTVLLGVTTVLPLAAHAGVTLQGTRVVYDAARGAATITASNRGQMPAMTQVWMDDGDSAAPPGSQRLPFLLSPTVRRIEAGASQSYRLTYAPAAGPALPDDRESVLYFNLLDVPPKLQDASDRSVLQFAVRTRIKLFYRPEGLPGKPAEAGATLRWHSDGRTVQVSNPSRYHVTLDSVDLPGLAPSSLPMLAPGATVDLAVTRVPAAGASIAYRWLDDYGGSRSETARLGH